MRHLPLFLQVFCANLGRLRDIAVQMMLIAATVSLAACGGGQSDTASMKETPRAQRAVEITELPNLYGCLAQLDASLQKNVAQHDLDLDCAAGTYRGLTVDGRECALKVDGEKGIFHFQVEREVVDIKWETIAYATNGRTIHNMENAGAPGQPGIQLTHYSGTTAPMTQALILRQGIGNPSLPKMIYQRTVGNSTRFIQCNFGA
jgi:hypothetical protein